MIVSHTYKYVCLNPPKTGSGMRERCLRNYSDKSIILSNIKQSDRHLKYTDVCKFFQKNNWDIEDYYTFTFVRNPWHRLESWYNMLVTQKKILFSRDSFEDFVREKLKVNIQYDYIYGDNKKVDYIGSLESIDTDFLHIFNKLKLNISTSNPPTRQNNRKYYKKLKSLWTKDLIDLVAQEEKYLIDKYNYKINI